LVWDDWLCDLLLQQSVVVFILCHAPLDLTLLSFYDCDDGQVQCSTFLFWSFQWSMLCSFQWTVLFVAIVLHCSKGQVLFVAAVVLRICFVEVPFG
jgi:hypothetical protein